MPQLRQANLERSVARTESIYVRLGLKIFAALVLLIGLIWGGRVLFLQLQERRLIQQAQLSLAKGDKRWATIAARRVFELNPENADASRLLARIAEGEGSSAAIDWRQQVIAKHPGSVEDEIALALTAVRFSRPEVAEHALSTLNDAARNRADFHDAAAQLALLKKDLRAAMTHFAEAARLDPANKTYELNLAIAQLQVGGPDERRQARSRLMKLIDDEKVRLAAARGLRDDAVGQRDASLALEVSVQIYRFPEAEFADRIKYLQLLHTLNHPDFAARLTEVQDEAAHSPTKLYELMTWMSGDNLALLALDWLKRLSPEILKQGPTPVAVANCYAAARDWAGLQAWCRDPGWGNFEFLRHAYRARSLREGGDGLESRAEWSEAVKLLGADPGKIAVLQEEAAKWGWATEGADLLWLLAKDQTQQSAALAALYKYYAQHGLTSDLYRVVLRLMELRPNDPAVLNNFAQLSLLLHMNSTRAYEVAEQLHAQEPGNPAFTSTYAFSLLDQEKTADALRAIKGLSADALRQPDISVYYGAILAASGERAAALEAFDRTANGALLPEEQAIVDKARRSLQ